MTASLDTTTEAEGTRLAFKGALDAAGAARLWAEAMRGAKAAPGALVLDLAGVTGLDTAGAVLLLRLEDTGRDGALGRAGRRALAGGAGPDPAGAGRAAAHPAAAPCPCWRCSAGRRWNGAREASRRSPSWGRRRSPASASLRRPWRLRFAEVLRHLDEAGLRAFGLTLLLGFLIGVILAFQSSVPMRRFGAETFIPNLVGLSLLRELGPLMAAVVLSGRTGSAYAAELGTMTVNEEVDALRIMGIDPIAWLVLPRLLAAVLVMPVLALLMDLSGLIGMGAVMAALGFPPAGVVTQLRAAIGLGDLAGGLFKAAVFGLSIGLVGCRAGLGAGRGPRAVGDAATAAVVGGIVSIVLLDGLFAILFFRLGW